VVDLVGGAVAYLRPIDGDYYLVAGTRDGLTVEYGDFRRRIPRQVRVLSTATDAPGRATRSLDLITTLSQLSLNVEIPDVAFSLSVPADVVPMALDELRGVGSLETTDDPS
jgi:hypothetical protein